MRLLRLILAGISLGVWLLVDRIHRRCPVSGEYCEDYQDCRNREYCWLKG